jgi:AmmeMemoRadiSam system protein B/AmmeMemoRadiSam system protein A
MIGLFKASKAGDGAARAPMVAGAFYPDNPEELHHMISRLLADAPPQPLDGPVYALVAPHAGYVYSAQIAARSFALIRGHKYKRVVVIAPSHVEPFSFTSIYEGAAYATPLGSVPVDRDFAEKLARTDPSLKVSDVGHGSHQGRSEHALEVELPFLQEVLGSFKLVPIVMGAGDYDASRALGNALASLIERDPATQEPDTLIVASSDLSHFHSYGEASSIDRKTLAAIGQNDYFSLSVNLEAGVWEACGGAPIMTAMIATERMGAKGRKILAYANSGDVTGDKTRVVGYGAAAFFRDEKEKEAPSMSFSLDEKEKAELLAIAKNSVDTAVRGKKTPPLPAGLSAVLQTPMGAFVTLTKNGELRGCKGFVTPSQSLAEGVRDIAARTALEDTRFPPVEEGELKDLSYEISVLSPFHRVTDLKEIEIGRDGLLIRKDFRQGLLLPQVATEYGFDAAEFVRQTEHKAGLPPGSWKDEDADLFAFSAFVFGEK